MNRAEKYGPWAIIAGASEGTGSAFAKRVAAAGINCILIARREAPLQSLAEEIRVENEVECVIACVDLGAEDALERIAEAAGSREVGLFINNSGADTVNGEFLDNDVQDWIHMVNRNVTTVVRCCHHFGGLMRQRGRGGILLVGSGSCYGGASFMAVYAGTKAFDLCLGEGLWAELRPHGVDQRLLQPLIQGHPIAGKIPTWSYTKCQKHFPKHVKNWW